MRHTHLVNYTLYQIGWFACVLGGASHRPWTGFLIAVVLLGAHLTLSPERSLEARLVVFATAVGALVEMGQIAAGSYRFTSGTVMDAAIGDPPRQSISAKSQRPLTHACGQPRYPRATGGTR